MCPYMGSHGGREVEETGERAFCEVQRRAWYFFPFHRAVKLLGMYFQLNHCSSCYSPLAQRNEIFRRGMLDFYGSMLVSLSLFLWLQIHSLFTPKSISALLQEEHSISKHLRFPFFPAFKEKVKNCIKFISMITLNHKMNTAQLENSHNTECLWESMMMRHSRVVCSCCLRARRQCSVRLGHSGLSWVRNATGTHSSAFLWQSRHQKEQTSNLLRFPLQGLGCLRCTKINVRRTRDEKPFSDQEDKPVN